MFFISKDTENLLYYDENSVDEDSFETDDECENEDDTDSEKADKGVEDSQGDVVESTSNEKQRLETSSDDFILDIDEMTKEFVSSVKEDAK